MNPLEIRALNDDAKTSGMLADLLIETVAAGGSVSFMHPLSPDAAHEFWRKSLAAAARGERALLGAWDGETLVGTVTLLLDCPPNQPHRAEIAKLMTRLDYRGKGIASGLMRAAEELAVKKGRTLLVLDTASEEGAGGLYEKLGFSLTGEIPDYALKPHGGLTGTLIYWKRIGEPARALS
ncbi:GNAT family N-acetyltransferase [Mesorhizobium sp. WSM3866]|uniref:GNAT family N-acetyltransferase n=1 Tax=Mesorhizobium sp. WSM3866 TaxID=422271 RepID=UPI000BAFEB4D|nr:GNAT family N-acetyltransferase [Mesorhizobium sp. WSM3866]PBB40269.1 GNAT family N-acetyltransferase [Mesorhizobium sp. WSM3866]